MWSNFFNLGGRVNNTDQVQGFTPIPGAPGSSGWEDPATSLMNEQRLHLEQLRRNSQFGFNIGTFNNVVGGLSSLGQLWQGFQANRMAKDQWKTQKSILNTNMMNQIQSYNNSLRDRLDTRAKMEGRDQESADRDFEERRARRH